MNLAWKKFRILL